RFHEGATFLLQRLPVKKKRRSKKKLTSEDSKKKSRPRERSSCSPKKSRTGSKSKAIVMDSSSDDEDEDEDERTGASATAADIRKSSGFTNAAAASDLHLSADSEDDLPLIKMVKTSLSDAELKETLETLLRDADLEEMTMKKICQKVFDMFPEHDLSSRKDFIKQTVKDKTFCLLFIS
uniref:DEK proto-oncogene n=1 Tax=Oryzias latipes TaxID=8090 RepID=A0A3P9I1I9_ORYLA